MAESVEDLLFQASQGSQVDADQAYNQILGQATESRGAEELLTQVAGESQAPSHGWQVGRLFWEGVQRNYQQLAAVPSALRAQAHAIADDPVLSMLQAAQAEDIESKAPKAQWQLQDVKDVGEFANWLAERFGENAITLLTAFAGGSAGAITGGLSARALGGSLATRRAAQTAGAIAGGFLTSAPIEIAATGQEQFQVTGDVKPQFAIPAGVAKGLLELWTPTKIIRSLSIPGRQLGETIAGAITRTAGREALTEGLQESIDIALRMHSDPKYSFFGEGPYPSMGEGAWRLLEASIAGGVIGGVVGAGPAAIEARQERGRTEGDIPPGGRELYREGIPPAIIPPDTTDGDDRVARSTFYKMPPIELREFAKTVVSPEAAENLQIDDLIALLVSKKAKPPVPVAEMLRPQPGSLVEVYRGDSIGFDRPDVTKAEENEPGLFFTTDLSEAEKYAGGMQKRAEIGLGEGSNIRREVLDTANFKEISWHGKPEYLGPALRIQAEQAKREGYSGAVVNLPARPGSTATRTQYIVWDQNAITEPGVTPASIRIPQRRDALPLMRRESQEPLPVEGVPEYPRSTALKGTITGNILTIPEVVREDTGNPEWFSHRTVMEQNEQEVTERGEGYHYGFITNTGRFVDREEAKALLRQFPGKQSSKLDWMDSTELPEVYEAVRRYLRKQAEQPDPLVPGPVTDVRNMLWRTRGLDKDILDATMQPAAGDLLGIGPMLRANGMPEVLDDYYKDFIEAQTPRYLLQMPNGSFSTTFYTDTDLEYEMALHFTQDVKPDVRKIKQDSLIPALITATLTDLPNVSDRRIWFLPGVPGQQQLQLLDDYRNLQEEMTLLRYEMLQDMSAQARVITSMLPRYQALLDAGLRVVPTRGASFMYGAGPVESHKVDPPTSSGRAKFWAYLTPAGSMQTTFSDSIADTTALPDATKPALGLPVTFDLNRFKKGEISGLPFYVHTGQLFDVGIHIPPGMTREAITLALQDADIVPREGEKWTAEGIEIFRKEFLSKGVYFDPTIARFDELLTKEPIRIDQLTVGVEMTLEQTGSIIRIPAYAGIRSNHTETDPKVELPDITVAYRPRTKQIAKIISDAIPTIKKIFNDIGLDKLPKIRIGGFYASNLINTSWAYHDSNIGEIVFNMSLMHNPWGKIPEENLESAVLITLMHEVGHAATLALYNGLPTELKQQLEYAWRKSLLLRRSIPLLSAGRFGIPDTQNQTMESSEYFTSYIEWLAEQFRRFTFTDTEIRSELDQKLGNITAKIDQLIRKFDEALGSRMATDLRNPDYNFTAVMQYLRDYGSERLRLRQLARQQQLYELDEDILNTPVSVSIMQSVLTALKSMENMFPEGHPFHLRFGQKLDKAIAPIPIHLESEVAGRTVMYGSEDRVLMEIAVGSLPENGTVEFSKMLFAHELIHAYRALGLISKQELNTLYTAAVKEGRILNSHIKATLKEEIERMGRDRGWSKEEIELKYQDVLREETVAYYVGYYAQSGFAREEVRPLLDRIIEVIRRVAASLMGQKYMTRDDVLEAFFRGEMARRPGRQMEKLAREQRFIRAIFFPEDFSALPAQPTNDPRYDMRVESESREDGNGEALTYQFYDKATGRVVGQYDVITDKTRNGYNLDSSFSHAPGMHMQWVRFIGEHLGGMQLLAPEVFTAAGMRAALRVYPELKGAYIEGGDGRFYSPKYVLRQIDIYNKIIEYAKNNPGRVAAAPMRDVKETLRGLNRMKRRFPKDIWKDKGKLDQLWMLSQNRGRDEIQGSLIRAGLESEEAKLSKVLGVNAPVGASKDGFTLSNDQAREDTLRDAASRSGDTYSETAPNIPEVRNMRRILSWIDYTGGTTPDKYAGYLKKVPQRTIISQEADRIGFFSRVWWGIQQLAWRNEHIAGLQSYKQKVELYHAMITSWHRDADDVARRWENEIRDPKQREGFNNLLFWLENLDFLTPIERSANIERHPTKAELATEARRRGLDAKTMAFLPELYQHPADIAAGARKDIFGRFLDAVEAVGITNITRTISDPVLRAKAITELQAEMNALRQKPYFPISRFGRHSITVRDSDPLNNRKVLYFATFDDHRVRDAALPEVAKQFPLDDIHKGRVPEEYFEFMGLPGPLLREIRASMPNLQPDQIAWIEEFERQNLPDKSFRKRWIPRSGTPGHSMDAFRSFAHYFMHGSRYLARLQFKQDLINSVTSVEEGARALPNASKRTMIVDYMKKHYAYLMEGGRDWAKFKSAISVLQLGFSPAAAFMNLTQTPMVSAPWLGAVFGVAAGHSQLVKSLRAVRNLRQGYVTSGIGNYAMAREEMVRQGRIDIGQAAELGAFAEGNNLLGLLAGTKRQRMYRNFVWASMWMFQKAEQINREVLMHAVWEQAHTQAKTNKRMDIIRQKYFAEIADLQSRLSTPTKPFTEDDAVSFILAKEALDQTQGLYAPYARPTFMRTPLAGTLLIFYQFIQTMTYAFRYNPGAVQMWLMMAFVYGAAGIPGAEDFAELMRLLGKKLFGKDFDLFQQSRRMVREISRGTIFDEVGPDLFVHGISRYGFGLGLLPDGYAIGKFDASANGSLGKLVPGLYEALHTVNTSGDSQQFIADTAQRLAGAGFGWFFNLAQFGMNSPGTVDGHRWEQALPRTIRAMAAGYRYAPIESLPDLGPLKAEGAATLPSGAKIVRFSATDPEDVAAVITQFLGFRPTRVSEAQELRREQLEAEKVLMARRATLFVQLTAAQVSGRPDVTRDVVDAIKEYNLDVEKEGRRELSITAQQMRNSLRSREQNRLLQEEFVSRQKLLRPEYGRIKDLYPGVRTERVR